jgi:hypothetical protein
LINRNQSDAFINGFNSWRVALEKKRGFKQHETSAVHMTATVAYHEFKQREKSGLSVIHVADKGRDVQIRKNRNRLIKISSAILLCGRQMIPLRGHEEHAESVSNYFTL